MKILGIESSCDETSAAVVENGINILSLTIYSQVALHKKFEGVVPEIASRNHLLKIDKIVETAIKEAKLSLEEIDGIAVTNKPGLIGSLVVGLNYAKGLAWALNKPIVYINHIEAHIYSAFFNNQISFPFLALVISGGHTLLYKVNSFFELELLSKTIDDAVGEALDKAAKLLELGYPGGPIIEEKARKGNENYLKFTMPRIKKQELNFSYSGIKTELLNYLLKMNEEEKKINLNNIAASFQKAAFMQLLKQVQKTIQQEKIEELIICGGVSANERLRELFLNDEKLKMNKVKIYFPEKKLCGDNAAMVAGLGYHFFKNNITNNLFEDAQSRIVKKQ